MDKNSKTKPMEKKLIQFQCPNCSENISIMEEKLTKELQVVVKKIEKLCKSSKSAIEKKLELFEVLEKLDFGEISPSENRRVNNLLQSRWHAELAKKYMKEYKKSTAEEFSKV